MRGPGRVDFMLVAILVVAAGLRLHGLTGESVDLDEATSVWFASRGLRGLLFRNIDLANPPLYYILLKGWVALFGTSELAIRLPSVIFSTAIVGATHALGRAVYDRGVARLAALLVALSSCQLSWSQDARMYPLTILLAVTSTHALWVAVARGGRARFAIYVVLVGAAAYSHYQGLVVILGHGVSLIFARALGRLARPGLGRELLAAGLVLLAGTLPILPLYLAGGLLSPPQDFFWQPHASAGALAALAVTWVAGARLVPSGAGWPPLLLLLLLLLPMVLAALARKRDRRHGVAADPMLLHLGTLYTGIAAFVALASVVPVWHPRYLAAFHPLFLLGLALGLRAFQRRAAAALAAVVLLALALAGLLSAKLGTRTKQDWRGAAELIAGRDGGQGARVFVLGPFYLDHALRYYRHDPFDVVTDPAVLVDQATRASASGRSVFVIYSDQHRPPDPERKSATLLEQRVGLRASTHLVGLHVYELGGGAPPR